MKHYITFDAHELNSKVTTMGHTLHNIARHITYYKEYTEIEGIDVDMNIPTSIKEINDILKTLRTEFNLPDVKSNVCLRDFTSTEADKIKKECNDRHGFQRKYKKG